jgi:hypothetical protein
LENIFIIDVEMKQDLFLKDGVVYANREIKILKIMVVEQILLLSTLDKVRNI